MDPNSGRLYTEAQMSKMTDEEKARLVELRGSEQDVQRISQAVAALNRAERRAAERAGKRKGR